MHTAVIAPASWMAACSAWKYAWSPRPRIGALDEREAFEVTFGNIQSYVGSDDDAGTHLDGRVRLIELAYVEATIVHDGAQAGYEAHELTLLTFADVDAGRVTHVPIGGRPQAAGSHVDAVAMGLQ